MQTPKLDSKRQLNAGMTDPQIIQALDLWYEKMKVKFIEQGLPPPHKRDAVSAVLGVVRVLAYGFDKWALTEGDLSAIQAFREGKKEATKEELREYVTSFFRKHMNEWIDELVNSLVPPSETQEEAKGDET